jgi:hypothetical protein
MAVTTVISHTDEDAVATPVCELRPGDIIWLGAERLLVAEEPVTIHRGLGLFDDFALFIGVEVQSADDGGPRRRLALEPDTDVPVARRDHEAG